jgi:hypothetical protein
MSKSDDEVVGAGCCGLIMLLFVIGMILAYWKQVLLVMLLVGVVVLLVMWVMRLVEKAEQQRNCPVCQSWTDSVLLAEFDTADGFCPKHAARWKRIKELEDEVLDEE